MEACYPERHHGYQLSLYNFSDAKEKLSGLDKLVKDSLKKSDIGYEVNLKDTKADYYITSTYDNAGLLEKLETLDSMQLGYVHHLISNNLRKKEVLDKFEYFGSFLITNARRYRLEREAYNEISMEDFQRPLIIEDFDNDTEYTLEKTYENGISTYSIKSRKDRNPMEGKYLNKEKALAINHYYDFSDLPREEADLCWDIFNAKISES